MPWRYQLFVMGTLLIWASSSLAGTKTRLGRHWERASLISIDQVQYSQYDTLLKKYVDRSGDVNYGAWQRSATDLEALDNFLDHLSQANRRKPATYSAQLAFWINAYNAVTLKGILREYPTTSITRHASKLTGYNIWHDLLLLVGGSEYSLDHIEHQILRKMNEPRIHFAIVCASRGCPKLRDEAYLPDKLLKQLEDNTRTFFSDSRNFRCDPANRRMELSKILKWFGSDFGSGESQLLSSIADYLPTPATQNLARSGQVRVFYLDYDWQLNDQKIAADAKTP
ncbi:MAG: hypothetical protein CMJ81_14735 [Planctomycetaceae bacterium]|nr:hypothetical protein [Planctomycetaceae bacterium]MBP63858.1 hypothetical protein [Planctomycetaceae bacterium]